MVRIIVLKKIEVVMKRLGERRKKAKTALLSITDLTHFYKKGAWIPLKFSKQSFCSFMGLQGHLSLPLK